MDSRRDTPKQVWYSLYALLGTVAVDFGSLGLAAVRSGRGPRFQDVAVYLIGLGILALVMFPVFRGRRWARIAYTIIVALNIGAALLLMLPALRLFIPPGQHYLLNIGNSISLLLGLFLQILSVYFLYVRESRNWFERAHGQIAAGMNVAEPSQDSVAPSDHETPSASETTASRSVRRERHKKVVLLAGGFVLTGCIVVALHIARQARAANAIRAALNADIALARETLGNRALMDCDPMTIQAYTEGLREIDMSKCPPHFQQAYLAHIDAWESYARSRDPANLLGPLIEASVSKIKALSSLLKLQQNTGQAQEEVTATWNEVKRVALSYGVRVPE
ncbi:MAG: hypothetical protein JW993_07120 [Sedimentisphaerales bacterium]|nr:hypothetical protein [Sedimentisphaerales bacterium]